MIQKGLLGIFIGFFSHLALATDVDTHLQKLYSFKHPNCEIGIILLDQKFAKKSTETFDKFDLKDEVKTLLKQKGFTPKYIKDKKSLYKGDMYFKYSYNLLPTSIYKECDFSMSLNILSNDRRLSKADRKLYSSNNKRALPRVTFAGSERCYRALKDSLIHVPYCIKN